MGWLLIFGHGLFLLIAAFVFLLLTSIGLAVRDQQASLILSIVGGSVGLFLSVLAVPGLVAGLRLFYIRQTLANPSHLHTFVGSQPYLVCCTVKLPRVCCLGQG